MRLPLQSAYIFQVKCLAVVCFALSLSEELFRFNFKVVDSEKTWKLNSCAFEERKRRLIYPLSNFLNSRREG